MCPKASGWSCPALQFEAGHVSCRRQPAEGRGMPESSAESFRRASLGFCRLFFSILWRRIGFERTEKTSRNPGYFIDRSQEQAFVCLRRPVEAADFSHELQ